MARLAEYFASVFGGFLEILVAWLGKKAAFAVALLAAYVTALTALWASISLLIGGLVSMLPQNSYTGAIFVGLNLVIPTNFELCVSAMLASDLVVFLYRFHTNKVVPSISGG